MKHKKAKHKKRRARYANQNNALSKLLQYALKKLIHIRRRKRSAPRKAVALPAGIIPKMTVISNSDAPTIKEQQGPPALVPKKVKKPMMLPVPLTLPAPASPKKNGYTVIDNKSGTSINVPEDKIDEYWTTSKYANAMKHQIDEANKKSTKVEEEKEKLSKEKEKLAKENLDKRVSDAQNALKLEQICKLHKIGSEEGFYQKRNHGKEGQGTKEVLLADLNTIDSFRQFFVDERNDIEELKNIITE